MTPPNNMIGWFEIPVTNMERAMQFYETVFAIKMERQLNKDWQCQLSVIEIE